MTSSQTFTWTQGSGAQYMLYIGTAKGALDFYGANLGTRTSVTLSYIPGGSHTFYVRLWTYITNVGWVYNDYTVLGPA